MWKSNKTFFFAKNDIFSNLYRLDLNKDGLVNTLDLKELAKKGIIGHQDQIDDYDLRKLKKESPAQTDGISVHPPAPGGGDIVED